MREIAEYLKANYYDKVCVSLPVPDVEAIQKALENHKEKVFVDIQDGVVRGAAIFLTLFDETYERLESCDIGNPEVLRKLLSERGQNIHFILICAEDMRIIMKNRHLLFNLKPKTLSWWNPTTTKLTKYTIDKESLCHR